MLAGKRSASQNLERYYYKLLNKKLIFSRQIQNYKVSSNFRIASLKCKIRLLYQLLEGSQPNNLKNFRNFRLKLIIPDLRLDYCII